MDVKERDNLLNDVCTGLPTQARCAKGIKQTYCNGNHVVENPPLTYYRRYCPVRSVRTSVLFRKLPNWQYFPDNWK